MRRNGISTKREQEREADLFVRFRVRQPVKRVSKTFVLSSNFCAPASTLNFYGLSFFSGNTAQFGGGIRGEFCAICCPRKSRFTAGKPSVFAVASRTKFIRICTTSFVRYYLTEGKERCRHG